jgi:hypothetical protein
MYKLRTGDASSEMHRVQVAESIKLEKTELEFELGQLTGQVERLQARIRTLIEEQVKIVPQIYLQLHLLDSFFGYLNYFSQGCLHWHLSIALKANAFTKLAPRVAESNI